MRFSLVVHVRALVQDKNAKFVAKYYFCNGIEL